MFIVPTIYDLCSGSDDRERGVTPEVTFREAPRPKRPRRGSATPKTPEARERYAPYARGSTPPRSVPESDIKTNMADLERKNYDSNFYLLIY